MLRVWKLLLQHLLAQGGGEDQDLLKVQGAQQDASSQGGPHEVEGERPPALPHQEEDQY